MSLHDQFFQDYPAIMINSLKNLIELNRSSIKSVVASDTSFTEATEAWASPTSRPAQQCQATSGLNNHPLAQIQDLPKRALLTHASVIGHVLKKTLS